MIRRCVNINGSFACELIPPCSRGYRRAFNDTCLDINECSEGLHNCRLNLHQYCVNKEGGFECLTRLPSCQSGYKYSLSTQRCEDIDECLTGQYSCDAKFSERCVNLPGTYRCAKSFSFSIWDSILGEYNKTEKLKTYDICLAGARDLLLRGNVNDQLVLPAIGIILIYASVQVHLIMFIKFKINESLL